MGTSVALAATHHPQSDGQTERSIQTLIQLLRCYSEERQDEWEQMLPLFQYALNDAYCEATGTTPFRVVLGRDPRSPFRFLTGEEIREVPLGPLELEAELSRRLVTVNDFVRRKQEEVAQRMQDRYNRTRVQLEFKPGDLVLLSGTRSHPKLAGKRKQGRIRVGLVLCSEGKAKRECLCVGRTTSWNSPCPKCWFPFSLSYHAYALRIAP